MKVVTSLLWLVSIVAIQFAEIPVIDISSLLTADESTFCEDVKDVSQKIDEAGRTVGFFYISNHGVSEELQDSLVKTAKTFFELPVDTKYAIAMANAGKAWRGYFGVGDEVTSGIPDQKEGLYFGTELSNTDPRPMHGANIWPADELGEQMKDHVLTYMNEMKKLGRLLMKSIACSLQITDAHFLQQFDSPTELFRIFNYPPHNGDKFAHNSMGVGEHTDYGYLTILRQDASGGLQVRSVADQYQSWLTAPPIANTFVINLGDALEHNTKGYYKATPHRVIQRVNATLGRISMPYFFDPSFDSLMKSMASPVLEAFLTQQQELQAQETKEAKMHRRWDKLDPALFQGTYGAYLMKKVAGAFPALFSSQLQQLASSSSSSQEL